jgi:hypothetical protein
MSALRPRALSNRELIKYFTMYLDDNEFGAPLDWQIELVRRFAAVAADIEWPVKDDKQLDLFS